MARTIARRRKRAAGVERPKMTPRKQEPDPDLDIVLRWV
jgi:hypothetical protein